MQRSVPCIVRYLDIPWPVGLLLGLSCGVDGGFAGLQVQRQILDVDQCGDRPRY